MAYEIEKLMKKFLTKLNENPMTTEQALEWYANQTIFNNILPSIRQRNIQQIFKNNLIDLTRWDLLTKSDEIFKIKGKYNFCLIFVVLILNYFIL